MNDRTATRSGGEDSRRILVVDDDRDFADSMVALLRPRGFEATASYDTRQALSAARTHGPQVALLDIRLESENGLQLVEQLHEFDPRIHCVMVTAYADVENAIEAVRRGAYDYLRKPVSPHDLFASIERCFDRVHLEERNAALEARLRQSQKLEAIGRLAGGVAHDFNNVLTVVLSNAELSLTALRSLIEEPNPVAEGLKEIERSVQHASAIIRQLLTFSRQRIGQLESVNLNQLLSDMEGMLRRLLQDNVILRLDLAPGVAPVRAEPGQMAQVILNLVINAQDAMPNGGEIRLATATEFTESSSSDVGQDTGPGARVVLTVSDTGHGMDARTLERIFEPFFSTKESNGGTGLGLATVYGIIEQAGGQIAVESVPGEGTIFRVALPIDISPYAESDATASIEAEATAGSGETIILCDDEDGIRSVVARALESSGYTVLETANGGQALSVVESHDGPVAALVTDLIMPGMNGRELAQKIIRRFPHIKVIITSGYASDIMGPGILPEAVFLQKPFTPSDLMRTLRRVLH